MNPVDLMDAGKLAEAFFLYVFKIAFPAFPASLFPLYKDTENGREAKYQLYSFVIQVWFAPMVSIH